MVGVCGRRERSGPGQDVRYDVGKENGASEIKNTGPPTRALQVFSPTTPRAGAPASQRETQCAQASSGLCHCPPKFFVVPSPGLALEVVFCAHQLPKKKNKNTILAPAQKDGDLETHRAFLCTRPVEPLIGCFGCAQCQVKCCCLVKYVLVHTRRICINRLFCSPFLFNKSVYNLDPLENKRFDIFPHAKFIKLFSTALKIVGDFSVWISNVALFPGLRSHDS
ncbi:hypothetical protein V8F33_001611 [Rhypophila sp. PSN 637]